MCNNMSLVKKKDFHINCFFFRVNDKMVKKTPPHMPKKNLSNHHSSTISPQPFQSEKSFLHEKLKSKSPDKREKEGLSLPEVKGAEGRPGVKVLSSFSGQLGNFVFFVGS